jgi:hypothetical protein
MNKLFKKGIAVQANEVIEQGFKVLATYITLGKIVGYRII